MPETASPPKYLYRIARSENPLGFSRIEPEDAALEKAGNRFDVPGGGVLYAGSDVECCFAETLSRYRPTPKIRELVKDEPEFMVVGGVPQDWRLQRVVVTLEVEYPLPFLDMESASTHSYLSKQLASTLLSLGYDDNLDFSEVVGRDRRLTRAIAHHAYTATGDDGDFLYGGIRYMSRIDPRWECWAIFDGVSVREIETRSILESDSDMRRVADMWELRVF